MRARFLWDGWEARQQYLKQHGSPLVIIIHSPHNAVITMLDAGAAFANHSLAQKSQKDYKGVGKCSRNLSRSRRTGST